MFKKALLKLSEIALIVTLTVSAVLYLGDGRVLDFTQAGETKDGENCSSLELAGDANGNEDLGITDALMILNYLFNQGTSPVPVCVEAGDAECDCPFTEEEVEQLLGLLDYISIDEDEYEFDDDSPYPKVVFSGCNVQITNGLGATNGDDTDPFDFTPTGSVVNGLGNLIVGYNELRDDDDDEDFVDNFRNGSHNLIVGIKNNYPSFGCVVTGRTNEAQGAMSNVNGGFLNISSGLNASVCGGCTNEAGTGLFAHVCGGRENDAEASFSVVVGGGNDSSAEGNVASAVYSVVVGGANNDATGVNSTVLGGDSNTAAGTGSSVVGGTANVADGDHSGVGGGSEEEEVDENGWTAVDG